MPRGFALFPQNQNINHNPTDNLFFNPANVLGAGQDTLTPPTLLQAIESAVTYWKNYAASEFNTTGKSAPQLVQEAFTGFLGFIDEFTGFDLVGLLQAFINIVQEIFDSPNQAASHLWTFIKNIVSALDTLFTSVLAHPISLLQDLLNLFTTITENKLTFTTAATQPGSLISAAVSFIGVCYQNLNNLMVSVGLSGIPARDFTEWAATILAWFTSLSTWVDNFLTALINGIGGSIGLLLITFITAIADANHNFWAAIEATPLVAAWLTLLKTVNTDFKDLRTDVLAHPINFLADLVVFFRETIDAGRAFNSTLTLGNVELEVTDIVTDIVTWVKAIHDAIKALLRGLELDFLNEWGNAPAWITNIVDKVEAFVAWIVNTIDSIIGGILGSIGYLLIALGTAIGNAARTLVAAIEGTPVISGLQTLMSTFTTDFRAMVAAITANPLTIVASATTFCTNIIAAGETYVTTAATGAGNIDDILAAWVTFFEAVFSAFQALFIGMELDIVASWDLSGWATSIRATLNSVFTNLHNAFNGLLSLLGLGNITTLLNDLGLGNVGALSTWLSNAVGLVEPAIAAIQALLSGAGLGAFLDDLEAGGAALANLINNAGADASTAISNFESLFTTTGTNIGTLGSLINSLIPGVENSLDTLLGFLGIADVPSFAGWLHSLEHPIVPASHVVNTNPELLWNQGFDTATAILATSGFTWDGTAGHTSPGAAKVNPTGSSTFILVSNAVAVAQGDQILVSVWSQWSSLTTSSSTPPPIALEILPYYQNAPLAVVTLASIGTPASNSGWVQLTATYSVPAGVDTVYSQPTVNLTATGGTVWFDDASITKQGSLAGGSTLVGAHGNLLSTIFGSNSIGNAFVMNIIPALDNTWGKVIHNSNISNVLGGFNLGADLSSLGTLLFGSPTVGSHVLPSSVASSLGSIHLGADLTSLASTLFGSPTVGSHVLSSAVANVLGGAHLGADLSNLATQLFGSATVGAYVLPASVGNVLGGAHLRADLTSLGTLLFGSATVGAHVLPASVGNVLGRANLHDDLYNLGATLFGSGNPIAAQVPATSVASVLGLGNLYGDMTTLTSTLFGAGIGATIVQDVVPILTQAHIPSLTSLWTGLIHPSKLDPSAAQTIPTNLIEHGSNTSYVSTEQTIATGNRTWQGFSDDVAITATIGSSLLALVTICCNVASNQIGMGAEVSWSCSGANTISAGFDHEILFVNPPTVVGGNFSGSWTSIVNFSAQGSTTFQMQYARYGNGGTSYFGLRRISVLPL